MSIARQAAHGVAWNMALGVSTRLLQLVGTLVLTWFIAPEAYGAAVTASIVVMTAGAFTSFAFGQYLIAKRAGPQVAAQAAIIYVALGVIAMVAVYLLRGPIGVWVDAPEMERYVLGFAIAQLIDRLRYVPERLIMRALRFRTLATVNGIGELAFTAAALATARQLGGYAIMFGALARSIVTSVLFLRAAPRTEWLVRARLRASDIRDLFAYGLPILVAIVADRATTRWDNLIMSRLFDSGVVGRYQLAYSLAEMPVINVAEHIGEVLMPSFSRMEPEHRERAVIRAARLMAIVVSPLGVGLGAVAPTVVAAFFNNRWGVQMAPMLAILSVMTVFRPMTWSATAYLQAVQSTRVMMLASFLRAIVVLGLVYVCGAAGGPIAACVGAGLGYSVHTVVTIAAVGRVTALPIGAYLRAVALPLVPCVPMFLAVLGVERGLAAAGVPLLVSLISQIATGAVVYVAGTFIVVRRDALELLRLARDVLRRKRAPA